MKQTETKIVQEWNYRFSDKKLTLSPYPYERFDAFNEQYIVEIKYRASWYDKLLIEFDKNIINEKKIKNKIPEKFSLTEKSEI